MTAAAPSTPAIVANPARCSGCGRCVAACPCRLLTLAEAGRRKVAVRTAEPCAGCRRCLAACPVSALSEARPI